jgi:hypothetical protein
MTTAIVITHAERHIPAELIGDTGKARLPGPDSGFPKSFKSAKQARRHARRLFGAGSLDMRKWQVKLTRGQSMQSGHLVAVEPMA